MEFTELNNKRRSHRSFKEEKPIARDVLQTLLQQASLAPSSFNQQGWEVVVIESPEMKKRIFEQACQQKQVLTSSALLVILGDCEQYKKLEEINQKSGIDANTSKMMTDGANHYYANNPTLCRDEAIRSATFFSMAFMYAATNMGLATGPMIGFDPKRLTEILNFKKNLIPVLMMSVGFEDQAPFPRGYRKTVQEFATFI